MGTPFAGSGLLAIIEFEIIYAPPTGSVSCAFDIDYTDTYALNFDLDRIMVTKTSGNYEYMGPVPKPPIASFTYSPMSPLINETVTFDASGSTPNGGAIVSYIWDFGDGNITSASVPTITHVYTSAGDFNVTLTVTDDEGFSDTTWHIITIYAERLGDLNGDGKIDIKDIAIAALAFGSFPGHPRWNPAADVDLDGVVSIIDILLIASNFGKFV
jgi:PKD repeat protein